MRVTILGCGGSLGVPTVTGEWGECDPDEPRNYRRRASILIEAETAAGESRTILIDTPPELREQLLRARVRRIDAVLFTHTHADHTHGLDDLRFFAIRARAALPVYAEAPFIAELTRRFDYAIKAKEGGFYRPILDCRAVDGPFDVLGVPVTPFNQDHGFGPSTGFRIGNFAYSIDVVRLNDAAFDALSGVTDWVVDCQSFDPVPSHSHLAQTLGWIERVKPTRAVLSHMGTHLDYRALKAKLPPGVEPGYDGMVIEVS